MRRVEGGVGAYSLLRCAEVVNSCVETHVRLEINAIPKMVHDLFDAVLKVDPAGD